MSLGGGYFSSQDKTIPGSYMVFISAVNTDAEMSGRGTAAMGFELDWGPEGEIFEITPEMIQFHSMELLGYPRTHDKLQFIREVLMNSNKLYAYRLNGGGTKASNTYATARYSGTRGNDIKIAIIKNVDDPTMFDVQTIVGTTKVDEQTVKTADELNRNDYVTWKTDATLQSTAALALTGGTNAAVDGDAHQTFLDLAEGYTFNAIGCASTEETIKTLYANYGKRMREEVGAKFQVVLHNNDADYEGVVNLQNEPVDASLPKSSGVYWMTGAVAGCGISESLTNKIYDGAIEMKLDYTQAELEKSITSGKMTLHRVNSDARILKDINSLTTLTDIKGSVFRDNATIRIIDEIASFIASTFNTKYIGRIKNNPAGRMSLWNDIVQHHKRLQDLGAIENFEDADVTVAQGKSKTAVMVSDSIEIAGTLEKMYLTCVVE